MLENSMVLPVPRKHSDGECPTCGTEFVSDCRPQADEDDSPIYQHRIIDCPICDRQLCEECAADGKAFACSTCHQTFCVQHQKTVADEPFCPACYVPALEAAYEATEADLAAVKREVAAYQATCERIAALSLEDVPEETRVRGKEIPGIDYAYVFGMAKAIAHRAPDQAQIAALMAA